MTNTAGLATACVLLSLAPSMAAPCRDRLPSQAEFPPRAEQTAALTPERLQVLAGGKGWGFSENVSIEAAPGTEVPFALAVRIPKGSIDPKHPEAPLGGVGFRWRAGIPASANTACLSYRLLLPADFAFNKGGKLPGLFGGDGPAGGKDVDGTTGFSARFMWRAKGAGEVYAYIPGKPEGRGASLNRGAWTFPRGRWVDMQQEVVLNSPGAADGVLRVWMDGQLHLERTDLVYRTVPSLGLAGVMADIFYGGKTAEWAAPKNTVVRITPFELGWQ